MILMMIVPVAVMNLMCLKITGKKIRNKISNRNNKNRKNKTHILNHLLIKHNKFHLTTKINSIYLDSVIQQTEYLRACTHNNNNKKSGIMFALIV